MMLLSPSIRLLYLNHIVWALFHASIYLFYFSYSSHSLPPWSFPFPWISFLSVLPHFSSYNLFPSLFLVLLCGSQAASSFIWYHLVWLKAIKPNILLHRHRKKPKWIEVRWCSHLSASSGYCSSTSETCLKQFGVYGHIRWAVCCKGPGTVSSEVWHPC